MKKLTKALMTDETGQAIVTKLTALSGQMHELAMATRGSAILFDSESDISVLGDGGYLAVYVGTTNPLVISGWTGDNSLVTGHLYYLIKSGTAVTSRDLGEYGGTAVTSTTFDKHGVPADDFAVGQALDGLDDRVTALESGSSGGLTADIKAALLACFANVAWAGNDGQDYYDALDAALNPPANLTRITAVYTQSGTVYETSSLDSLKSDLVVTAYYDNATTQIVTNYTLSGTLTEGTSTITVSYGGKTTTFNVTVSEALPMLYPLTNGVHTLEDGSILTITDNNHIKLEASASPSQFVNLYTCEAGAADVVNNKPVWFTLPASASTTLTVKDITKTSQVNTQFNLRKALSTASSGYSLTFNSYITDPTDKTYTPGSDENISCPFLYQPRANQTFEFTLELVVNDVRYI